MKSFFYLCENREIRDKAYDFIFSQCNKAEYLITDKDIDLSIGLIGTGYEEILSDLVMQKDSVSWGMDGRIYTFKLSDAVKRMIKENGLSGIIKLINSNLENLCLYFGKKQLYDTCSHEGYTDIDGAFEKQVGDYCYKIIEETEIYRELLGIYENLKDKNIEVLKEDYIKLSDVGAYIRDEWKPMIYQPPKYQLSYESYVQLAEKYLTCELVGQLKKFKSFKDLYPTGFPRSLEEIKKFVNVPSLESTQIYREIKFQLEVLNIVFYKNGVDLFPQTEPPESFTINLNFVSYKDNNN